MKIVFCHNVFNRFKTLYNTISLEKKIFPNSQCIVGYNAADPSGEFSNFKNIEFIKFEGLSHKIGCVNGCISTIKASLKYDPDVIIFSHDDVYIHTEYLNILNLNIEFICNEVADVIVRKTPAKSVIGDRYYMMEAFLLSKNAAERCFSIRTAYNDEQDIDKDIVGSISPEVLLYNLVNIVDVKVMAFEYDNAVPIEKYNDELGSTIGFYHKNIGYRGWNDEMNYLDSSKQY